MRVLMVLLILVAIDGSISSDAARLCCKITSPYSLNGTWVATSSKRIFQRSIEYLQFNKLSVTNGTVYLDISHDYDCWTSAQCDRFQLGANRGRGHSGTYEIHHDTVAFQALAQNDPDSKHYPSNQLTLFKRHAKIIQHENHLYIDRTEYIKVNKDYFSRYITMYAMLADQDRSHTLYHANIEKIYRCIIRPYNKYPEEPEIVTSFASVYYGLLNENFRVYKAGTIYDRTISYIYGNILTLPESDYVDLATFSIKRADIDAVKVFVSWFQKPETSKSKLLSALGECDIYNSPGLLNL